jgi:hypothetical protein
MTGVWSWIAGNVRALLEVAVGGLIATVLTIYASSRQERTKISLKIFDEFLAKRTELAQVRGLLQNPKSLLGDDQKINFVKGVGNWYEIVATLYLSGMANRRLIDEIGIKKLAQSFHAGVVTASKEVLDFQGAIADWTQLKRFREEP